MAFFTSDLMLEMAIEGPLQIHHRALPFLTW